MSWIRAYLHRSRLKSQHGMTLLEIMIVVVILASLMAVLGRTVTANLKKARVKEARIQIGELSKALDMYYTDCGNYPTTEQGLNALAPGGESTCTNWGPEPYIKKKDPVDPWNHPFIYTQENGQYHIKSLGESGRDGATGPTGNITSDD